MTMVDMQLDQEQKARDEAARLSVQARAEGQPDGYFDGGFDNILTLRIPELTDGVPGWSIFPRARDRALRKFAHTESILQGGLYSFTSQIKSLEYDVIMDPGGSERKRKRAYDILNEADYGAGLPALVEKVAFDLETQDNGAFIEIWASGKPDRPLNAVNEIRGIAHLDSGQCIRTFDREFPVVYIDPLDGTRHKLHKSRVITMSKMASSQEVARNVGTCAVSRVLRMARYMRNVLQFKDEKVSGRFNRAIGYGSGLTGPMLREALNAAKRDDDAKGYVMYRDIPFLLPPGQGIGDMKLALLDLASVQEGFNFESELTLYVYILALCFGTDARDFWPATASGATKADASVQNMKARGKGKGDTIQIVERAINYRIIPDGLRFKYDFTDDDQDEQQSRIHQTKAATFVNMKAGGLITAREARAQAIIAGVLDPAGLFEEQEITNDAEPMSDTSDSPDDDDEERDQDEGNPDERENEREDENKPPFQAGRRGLQNSKALQATRLDFEDGFYDILQDANTKATARRRAGTLARSHVKAHILAAFKDGLADGGVLTDTLDADDQLVVNTAYSQASAYITDLLDTVYDAGLSEAELSLKPAMWFNKTIYPAYLQGLASADANALMEWELGRTEKHCKDCLRLAGQRHRLKAWMKKGLVPKSEALACGGHLCDCKFTRASGKATGRF